jgi:hypothetical protein
MASRHEEKEQRRQERLAREAAAAAAAKRKRLMQIVGGVVVACAVIVGVVLAAGSGGGDKVDNADLTAAAKKAGCVYRSFPNYGQNHIDKTFTMADYKTNPPTSGDHVPSGKEAQAGLYAPGNEPQIGAWVHTLEHGRILFQYLPGTSRAIVSQLDSLYNEDVKGSGGAYHSVLMQNNTKMPFQVAAVAWRHYMGCKTFTPATIAAFREFRTQLVDKAPELIP